MTDPKAQNASQKPRFQLMSYEMISSAVMALDYGANVKKYGAYNWRDGDGVNLSTYVAAIMRHASAIAGGQLVDPESGLYHEQHIAAGAAIIADARACGKLIDDISGGES